MSQTTYSRDFAEAYAGMKADSRFDTVESYSAQNAVDFGRGLVAGDDTDRQIRQPLLNKTTLSIDADLVTSNSTIATVNGNDTAAVVFDTDHATTMALIATAIAALDGVLSATYAGSGRDIVIVGDNVAVTASAVTTLGASQGTWTQDQESNDVFRGVSLHQHVEKTSAGVAQYAANDTVSVLRKGVIWVLCNTEVNQDAAAYVNVQIAASAGQFTEVSSGNLLAGVFRSGAAAGALAKVELNLPQLAV